MLQETQFLFVSSPFHSIVCNTDTYILSILHSVGKKISTVFLNDQIMSLRFKSRFYSKYTRAHTHTTCIHTYKMHVLLNMTCSILEDAIDEEAVDLHREVHTKLLHVICTSSPTSPIMDGLLHQTRFLV